MEAEDHGPHDLRAPPMKLEEDRKPMLENVPRGIPVEVIPVRHPDFQAFSFGGVLSKAQFLDLKLDGEALWVATERGLLRFVPGEPQAMLYGEESAIPGVRVTSLEVLDGRVVADLSKPTTPGCALGLGGWIFDPGTLNWSRLGQPSDWGFHRDGNTLWIAAYRPVRLDLRTDQAVLYGTADGLLHESVSDIATVGSEVWFAMFGSYQKPSKSFAGGGVSCLNLDTGRWKSFTEKSGLAYGYSCDLAADGKQVWVVHWEPERGTSVYDRETGKWTVLRRSAEGISLGGVVVALASEAVWFGQQRGLVRFDRATGSAKLYREEDGLPGYIVSGVVVGEDAVWASAYAYGSPDVRSAGLVRFPRAAGRGQ